MKFFLHMCVVHSTDAVQGSHRKAVGLVSHMSQVFQAFSPSLLPRGEFQAIHTDMPYHPVNPFGSVAHPHAYSQFQIQAVLTRCLGHMGHICSQIGNG